MPAPVFHPLFMTHMYNILRGGCLFCHKFKLAEVQLVLYTCRLKLLNYGLVQESDRLAGENLKGHTNAGDLLRSEAGNKPRKTSEGTAEGTLEDADGDGEFDLAAITGDEAIEVESPSQFRKRLEKQVSETIYEAVRQGRVDRSQDQGNSCYAARRALINEFIKAIAARKRCEHCHA